MATAKKKAPARRTAAPKKPAAKKRAKGNFFSNILQGARDQMDEFMGSAKHKAKEIAAKEKLMEKKLTKQVKTAERKPEVQV